MAGSYVEEFGHPPWISEHAMERMNTDGISPRQLANALETEAVPGVSPGTMSFVGEDVTAIVNEEGMIVTVYWTR